jgi:hypothetical protein
MRAQWKDRAGSTWKSPSITTLQEEETQADHVKDGN